MAAHAASGGPLIAVCLRQADRRPQIDPLTGDVTVDARSASAGYSELAALELALRMSDRWDGRVLAVAAGGPEVVPTLRNAAAVGAEVLRVPWSPDAYGESEYLDGLAEDGAALAAALVAAIRGVGDPDLVLCGDRSEDRGTGTVPAFLAAELGAAQALGLVELAAGDDLPDGTPALRAQRRLDGGRREVLRVRLPAVCSVEAAGVRLRRAALGPMLAAGTLEVPTAVVAGTLDHLVGVFGATPYRPRTRLAHPAPQGEPRERLLALTGALSARTAAAVLGPLDPAEAATALLDWLADRGYLATTADAGA